VELPGWFSSTLGSPDFLYSQCLRPRSIIGNQPSREHGLERVDSPLLAVRVEIPVDLYDEEEVWLSQTGGMNNE